jgi:hypothetical protein
VNGETTFTLADLEKLVEEHESNAIRVKTIINELCRKNGLPERYPAQTLQRSSGGFRIRSDQFHARPLATCLKEFLELRRNADLGPAAANEIFEALLKGGFSFGGKTEDINRAMVYNALTKNPAFYRLPNKQWGLREWYPNAKVDEKDDAVTEKPATAAPADSAPATEPSIAMSPEAVRSTIATCAGRETGVSLILKALATADAKTLTLAQIVEKVPNIKKTSISATLFRLKRDKKVDYPGEGKWVLR